MRFDQSRARGMALAFVLTFVFTGACSSPQSFIVLNLHLADGDLATEIAGITSVSVVVREVIPIHSPRTLTYDATVLDGGSLTVTKDGDRTLSISFSGAETGAIMFDVFAFDAGPCIVGMGTATNQIRKGGAIELKVAMTSAHDCSTDGGVPDAGTGAMFAGCLPVSPATRDAGVMTCSAIQTCQVNCAAQRNECIMGGTNPPGSPCMTNADCQPGTQCFDYSGTGCATKVCLRFCGGTPDCVAFGNGGGGPGSVCEGRVVCSGVDTAYHTCTFNCDPTAPAASALGNCPGTLKCLMPASMDKVDCACPEPTRTKTAGEPCNGAADCAPGFICNVVSGVRTCRAICRCNKNSAGACTTDTCSKAADAGATTCTPVSDNTVYGVCL